jgi:uncharacterized protein (DUF1778 family)
MRRKPLKSRKEDSIRVRLTKDQRKTLEAAANREHMDLSAWARKTLLKAAEAQAV